jgi:osmotically-inducible protein OsmY
MRLRTTSKKSQTFVAAVALVAVCGFSACAARRSPGTRLDDATITVKVKSKIAADPALNPFEVDVDTTDGVVRLSGSVEQESDRGEMQRLAENTRGVREVVNEIRLGDPKIGEVLSDSVIEAKVKAKFAADPEINPFRIDVDVVQGVVTLTGEVADRATREEAARLAAATKGVDAVENEIKLKGHGSS